MNTLTPSQRTYLDAIKFWRPKILLATAILKFQRQFGLTPEQAGRLIAQHILED